VEGWICVRALRVLIGLNDQPYLGLTPLEPLAPALTYTGGVLVSSTAKAMPRLAVDPLDADLNLWTGLLD